ncbi:MAG TPA: hypothetical protein VFQ45_19255 [Longimicrobium sp.]|nr:hypothetical protein [Longimicrobium sp.]
MKRVSAPDGDAGPARILPAARRVVLAAESPRLAPYLALPGPFDVVCLPWPELLAELPARPPSTVVLLDLPAFAAGDERVAAVRAVTAAAPLLPVLGLLPFTPEHAATLERLLAAGISDVADTQIERDAGALLPRLLRVHAQPFQRRVEQGLSPFVSQNALTLLRAAAHVAVDRGNADDLARLFGAGERTVAGWCAREGLPAPRRLLAWLRALLALALLEEPRRTVLSCARAAGFANDHPLRRSLRELLGGGDEPPRGRRFGDAQAVLGEELAELRARARKLRRLPQGA